MPGEELQNDVSELKKELLFVIYTEASTGLKDEHQLLLQLTMGLSLVRESQQVILWSHVCKRWRVGYKKW